MIKNILSSWKTSLIALFIFISGLVIILTGHGAMDDLPEYVVGIFTLLFAKDWDSK